MWKPITIPASSAAAHSGSHSLWFQYSRPGTCPDGRLATLSPIEAACWISAIASSTSTIGISAAGTRRSGATDRISDTIHSFSARAASAMSARSSMSEHHMPIDWYITSPQTPSWSRSAMRSFTSRDPGGRCDISTMVSPVSLFAVITRGTLRVNDVPSTSTSSSSSLIMRVRGIRSACEAGMIWCQRSAGSRKCESPEWVQILSSLMDSWYQ